MARRHAWILQLFVMVRSLTSNTAFSCASHPLNACMMADASGFVYEGQNRLPHRLPYWMFRLSDKIAIIKGICEKFKLNSEF